MGIPDEAICKVCQSVFCCTECRQKHEIKYHAIIVSKLTMTAENEKEQTNLIFCPICEKRPLVLRAELHKEMLIHIELYHLPLRCQKCLKIYKKINDLKQFSNCVYMPTVSQNQESIVSNQSCHTDEASKVTVTKAAPPQCAISQNSPLEYQDINDSHMTPISIINMRWKVKNKLTQEEFISDSVSSIKNISSISNSSIKRTMGAASVVKGKVIRCSSTPVQLEMVSCKPKEQTFNATGGGHMSSIRYNSGCESDNSPALSQPTGQALEPVNRYMKVTASRPRMSAVTPLRQVMSKSIQKAFAEHGLPSSTAVRGLNALQRKNMFDSTTSPEVLEKQSPQQPPLDLRLSPAVRRSQSVTQEVLRNQIPSNKQSALSNLRHEILLSAQKLTTESIVITRTEHLSSVSSSNSAATSNYQLNSLNFYPKSINSSYQSAVSNSTGSSMFKSCSSVEIITATTEEIQQLQSFNGENVRQDLIVPLTPITRIPGAAIHKKIIKFETPKIESCNPCEFQNSPNDVFFTPNTTPMHSNCEIDSAESKQRKLLLKQNLSGRFSPLRRPSIKECSFSTGIKRIENAANDSNGIDDQDDDVFLPPKSEKLSENLNNIEKESKTLQPKGLWSLMASVIRLPSRKVLKSMESYKSEQCTLVDSNSNSIIKRCATIAGSLVRSKSLVGENELGSLKRKRTYTTDNQSTSAYFAELKNSEATSPTSDINYSSKRFRIHGRRPIHRMRLNS